MGRIACFIFATFAFIFGPLFGSECYWELCHGGRVTLSKHPLDLPIQALKHEFWENTSCASIIVNDSIDSLVAIRCMPSCEAVNGLKSSLCSAVDTYSMACFKARTALLLGKFANYAWVPYAVALLYGFPGFANALPKIWIYLRVGFVSVLELEHQQQSGAAVEAHELLDRGGPDEFGFRSLGPTQTWFDSRFVALFGARTDLEATRILLLRLIPGMLLEPTLDIAGVMSYIAHGQPVFALATSMGIISVRDPFQLKAFGLLLEAVHRGYMTPALLEHSRVEGFLEGSVGCWIALFDLLCHCHSLGIATIILRLITIGQSVFLTMPNAATAHALIRDGIDISDYYGTQRAIARLTGSAGLLRVHWNTLLIMISAILAAAYSFGYASGFLMSNPIQVGLLGMPVVCSFLQACHADFLIIAVLVGYLYVLSFVVDPNLLGLWPSYYHAMLKPLFINVEPVGNIISTVALWAAPLVVLAGIDRFYFWRKPSVIDAGIQIP